MCAPHRLRFAKKTITSSKSYTYMRQRSKNTTKKPQQQRARFGRPNFLGSFRVSRKKTERMKGRTLPRDNNNNYLFITLRGRSTYIASGSHPLKGEGSSSLLRLLITPYPRLPALGRLTQTHSMAARRRKVLPTR